MPAPLARHLGRTVAIAALFASAGCYERLDDAGGQTGILHVGHVTVRAASSPLPFLHYEFPGDEGNAASFDDRHFDPSALSIVGAGADSVNRRVRVWDDLMVTGKTYVSATQTTITAGAGPPKSTAQSGSIYLRTDGSTGARLYVSAGNGAWRAVNGV